MGTISPVATSPVNIIIRKGALEDNFHRTVFIGVCTIGVSRGERFCQLLTKPFAPQYIYQ